MTRGKLRDQMHPSVRTAILSLLFTACAAADPPAPKTAAEPDKAVEDGVAKRRAEREAKAAAAQAAEAEKQAQIAAVATLPDKLPKNLDKACDEVAAAQDAFMRKWFPNELSKWESAKGTQMGLTKTTCTGTGSIEVAACQAKALTDAPEALRKEVPALFSTCIDKFGPKPSG